MAHPSSALPSSLDAGNGIRSKGEVLLSKKRRVKYLENVPATIVLLSTNNRIQYTARTKTRLRMFESLMLWCRNIAAGMPPTAGDIDSFRGRNAVPVVERAGWGAMDVDRMLQYSGAVSCQRWHGI